MTLSEWAVTENDSCIQFVDFMSILSDLYDLIVLKGFALLLIFTIPAIFYRHGMVHSIR